MSQGVEIVHGTDLGATVSGTEYVYGLASGAVVGVGGYQLVSAGGTVSAVSISGGTLELQGGASNGSAPISFTGGGELMLDASTSFSGTVAGFDSGPADDSIDFADIAYVAPGSAGATTVNWSPGSGTLSVSEGGYRQHHAAWPIHRHFNAAGIGGGTLVTYSPVVGVTESNPQIIAATCHS